MTNYIFCVDANKKPLAPVKPSRARKLLDSGKAAVLKLYPFTIILKQAITYEVKTELALKIDPGSKFTGLAILNGNSVIWGAEIEHRGYAIKDALQKRRSIRGGRRARKTRYRKARFLNRKRAEVKGWLAPSLKHRVYTTMTWVERLRKIAPITALFQELVKFDFQKMENAEISGVEYQQGALMGYETKEYLLEKWNRTCAYCGIKNVPLEVEHINPKSKGGSNRVSNLTLACVKCNKAKSNKPIEEFLAKKPELLKKIKAQAKAPLRDAAAVNSTRWALANSLKNTGLTLKFGSGGQTKFNRITLGLPKTHWIDAACVGKKIDNLTFLTTQPLQIKAFGHGCRQMVRNNAYGTPISKPKLRGPFTAIDNKTGKYFEFRTGDIVKAVVPAHLKNKYAGKTAIGKVTIKKNGAFTLPKGCKVEAVKYEYCQVLHHKDGYAYTFKPPINLTPVISNLLPS